MFPVNKMKHCFGVKYSAGCTKLNQKIIQMKKTERKIDNDSINEPAEQNDKSFHSIRTRIGGSKGSSIIVLNTAGNSVNSNHIESKQTKECKPIRKLWKYMKKGAAVSSRVKVVSKPGSTSRKESLESFMNESSYMKKRRGSTLTSCSNNTSKYCSVDESKRKHLNSNSSIKNTGSAK